MKKKEKIYNIIVFILCIVSVGFAIKDFMSAITPTEAIIDQVIYGLFVIDYIVRLIIAEDKKLFFKESVFDLLAIMPFNSAFRAFRMFRLIRTMRFAKMLRFTKFFRVGSVSGRLLVKARRFFDTNGFKYVLMLSGCAILLATVGIMHFEHMSFTDALWWSFVTATTVGYGDLSPGSGAGRIIAAALMLVGIGLIGSLTSTITSFFLYSDKEEISTDKIEMVMTLYETLSENEKKELKKLIIKRGD